MEWNRLSEQIRNVDLRNKFKSSVFNFREPIEISGWQFMIMMV